MRGHGTNTNVPGVRRRRRNVETVDSRQSADCGKARLIVMASRSSEKWIHAARPPRGVVVRRAFGLFVDSVAATTVDGRLMAVIFRRTRSVSF